MIPLFSIVLRASGRVRLDFAEIKQHIDSTALIDSFIDPL